MDDGQLSKLLTKLGLAILILAVFDLGYINWWVLKKSQDLRTEGKTVKSGFILKQDSPGSSPIIVSSPSPTSAQSKSDEKIVESKTVVEKQTQVVIQNAQKEIFIPIGSASIKNGTYTDLAGLEITIDTDKYPKIESAVFEASINVEGGNGRMYAQLYNATDKHPVWFSELSTSSSASVFSTSKSITLDTGIRTYRVQAKTDITDFSANVNNARIKITLK